MPDPVQDLDDCPMLDSLQPFIERFLTIGAITALLFFILTTPMGVLSACCICLALSHVPAFAPYRVPLPHDQWETATVQHGLISPLGGLLGECANTTGNPLHNRYLCQHAHQRTGLNLTLSLFNALPRKIVSI